MGKKKGQSSASAASTPTEPMPPTPKADPKGVKLPASKSAAKSPTVSAPPAVLPATPAAAVSATPERASRKLTSSTGSPTTAAAHGATPSKTGKASTNGGASFVFPPKDAAAKRRAHAPEPAIRLIVQVTTYLSYAVLMCWCYIRETYRKFFPSNARPTPEGYAPLVRDFDDMYTRRLYRRIRDCWNRPIDTRPGRIIGVMERRSLDNNATFFLTGRSLPCINLASYNYLGFSENIAAVTANNLVAVDRFGTAACASAQEGGGTTVLRALEAKVAQYVGKEDAVAFAMGFATNFSGLASLLDKDTLVLSDSLNHCSLVWGVRISAGQVKVFPHNRLEVLEQRIRHAIVHGQPRTHRPWKRIVILVEGVYSMEGEIIDLPAVVAIKKKYRCLLYVDEAHSIGALGATGRGVCEHHGVDPRDVDLLMGTFTKSFGSIGGYIAGDRNVIAFLRRVSGATVYGEALASAAAEQALSSLRVILGEDGTNIGAQKIRQLRENAIYFRDGLKKLGLTVFGEDASPVIPVMLYNPAKMPAFSRKLLKRGLAVVVVGYPATSLIESRARFCVSAAHTREDLDHALKAINEVASEAMIRYERPAYFV
jgi:serine palmitoyltransferase